MTYEQIIEKLQYENGRLEKALDKACEQLDDFNDCTNVCTAKLSECPFYDECHEDMHGGCIQSVSKWKEWCLKDE